MIIGKIMMIQNSSPVDSVEYLISKKTIELKDKIKDYTLNRFIDEIGVSKTSMVRYLKSIQIHKFTYFKKIMYEEYRHAEVDMRLAKQTLHISFQKKEKDIFEKIMKCQRILILGDGNRFSLLLYQKGLTYLNYPCEIPVYLGSEEEIIEEYHLTENDLVIVVSLHETYDNFLANRAIFYRDAKYLELKSKAKIGFIGVSQPFDNENLYFEYDIPEENFDLRVVKLQEFFFHMMNYILFHTDIIQ